MQVYKSFFLLFLDLRLHVLLNVAKKRLKEQDVNRTSPIDCMGQFYVKVCTAILALKVH